MDLLRALALALPALVLACNGGDTTSESESANASAFTVGESATSGLTGSISTGSGGETSTGAATSSTSDTADASTAASSSTTGVTCDPEEDFCCLADGEIPPHNLLDAFLAAYPPASMPKTLNAVSAFEPVADGHSMAWSDENVGGELVDDDNGGVIEANIEAGRALSREAAEASLPPDAVILAIRDEPVIIESLGTPPPCIGLGWAWGSILARLPDTSIRELVYLYIGFCSSGDTEAFYYSNEPFEICPAVP